jgi:hypothetical protein
MLCAQCGDVIRCHICKDIIVPEPIEDNNSDAEDEEMDYDYPDDDIDESSEDSLVGSLTSSGMILSEEELLWFAGETNQQNEDDDNLMQGCWDLPTCLWD